MCGVWGFNGVCDWKELIHVVQAAEDRGGHSSGFFGIDKKGNQRCILGVRLDVESIIELAQDCIMGIGHARLATTGEVNVLNAQPFVTSDMALVHNGTIPDYKEIMQEHGYVPHTDNDSEAAIPLVRSGKQVPGTYLAIRYGDHKPQFHAQKGQLPLFHNHLNYTTYYCSKIWRER